MTLNKYLQDNGINLTKSDMYYIGLAVRKEFEKLGLPKKKTWTEENGLRFQVNEYPDSMQQAIQDIVIEHLKKKADLDIK